MRALSVVSVSLSVLSVRLVRPSGLFVRPSVHPLDSKYVCLYFCTYLYLKYHSDAHLRCTLFPLCTGNHNLCSCNFQIRTGLGCTNLYLEQKTRESLNDIQFNIPSVFVLNIWHRLSILAHYMQFTVLISEMTNPQAFNPENTKWGSICPLGFFQFGNNQGWSMITNMFLKLLMTTMMTPTMMMMMMTMMMMMLWSSNSSKNSECNEKDGHRFLSVSGL